jgi:type IV secretory pathway protease TraF
VAAVAGEEVCGVEGELFVHGEAYSPIYTEAEGKPLPYLDGCQMVPQGTVFLASQAPKSLDSRYFNAVPLTAIAATAVPLWTWR